MLRISVWILVFLFRELKYFSCYLTDFEFHINISVAKSIFYLIPIMNFGKFFFQCFVYLVLRLIVVA